MKIKIVVELPDDLDLLNDYILEPEDVILGYVRTHWDELSAGRKFLEVCPSGD